MRAKEFLIEKKLGKTDFGPDARRRGRIAILLNKINSGSPFLLAGGGGEVILEKNPAVIYALSTGDPTQIPNQFRTVDGRMVRLTELEKTSDFGGQSEVDVTANPSKESVPLKPSKIGITGTEKKFNPDDKNALSTALATGAFPAGQLSEKIINNQVLKTQAGPAGLEVIRMATEIEQDEVPTMPTRKDLPVTSLKAIRDYSGEYLGIQQLVKGTANFPNNDAFFEFLDTDQAGLNDLILYFPLSSNTPLADSLALQNSSTGHVIKLSSKGSAKGAPPSLDNLKIPDEFLADKDIGKRRVSNFLRVAQSASGASQPFDVLAHLVALKSEEFDESIRELFPISADEFNALYATHTNPKLPCPRKFLKVANIKSNKTGQKLSGSHYGRVHYQFNKLILDAVNKKNIFPKLNKTVLEILGYNFIQVFSRERQGKLFADVLWPGTVNGHVEIYSKASSADPTGQKLSFSVTD